MALKLAIYGYDTDVGRLLTEIMGERNVEVEELFPLSPLGGEYDALTYGGRNYRILPVDEFDFSQADAAVFLTPPDELARVGTRAEEAGCIVIDTSGMHALDAKIPLLLPELKDLGALGALRQGATRLCTPASVSTAIALILAPLGEAFGLRRALVTVLESVSERGRFGVETLSQETIALLNGQAASHEGYPAQVAFNVIPRLGELTSDGSSDEEWRIRNECSRLLGIRVSDLTVTVLQVPVFFGHTLSLHVEFEDAVSAEEIHDELANVDCIELAAEDEIPTPVGDGVGMDKLIVTRLRTGTGMVKAVDLVAIIDNTRMGEALNCCRVVELVDDFLKKAK